MNIKYLKNSNSKIILECILYITAKFQRKRTVYKNTSPKVNPPLSERIIQKNQQSGFFRNSRSLFCNSHVF